MSRNCSWLDTSVMNSSSESIFAFDTPRSNAGPLGGIAEVSAANLSLDGLSSASSLWALFGEVDGVIEEIGMP